MCADRPYRAGRSPDWIKVKNRKHPAMERVEDFLGRLPLFDQPPNSEANGGGPIRGDQQRE